jgi:hypothetical protein
MNIEEQVSIFREMFMGRTDVYGTYDPATGRAWQVKAAITDDVVQAHLTGMRPLGLYLLVKDTVWASVVDFDTDETEPPMEFVAHLRDVGLPGYVERSKSKGYHVWLFFSREGVKAHDARRLLNGVLAKMGQCNVEVFPKQDHLANDSLYGNFINLPLFGRLVPRGRTVFVDEDSAPVQDQWTLLTDIRRVSAIDLECLDKRISANQDHPSHQPPMRANRMSAESASTYGLYPCAQKMLKVGVRANQRTACFRLASQLRKAGLPYEYAVVVLARLSPFGKSRRQFPWETPRFRSKVCPTFLFQHFQPRGWLVR